MELQFPAAKPGTASPDAPMQPARPLRATAPPAAEAPAPQPAVEFPGSALARELEAINQAFGASSRGLEFTSDPDTRQTVVRIVDNTSREVVRQFPSEETLAIAKIIDLQRERLLRQRG